MGHNLWDKKNKMKKWKEENKKWKRRKKRKKFAKIVLTNTMCKGLFVLQIIEKLRAFWNKLFGNFYFYPVLWNDRV